MAATHPRLRRRIYGGTDPTSRMIGELARDTDDVLEALWAQMGELQAGGGSGSGVSDHGALTGLGDDDHAQYIRVDGTRAFTGAQAMGGNKITGLAAATANGDALRYEQLGFINVWDARVVPAGLHAHSDEFPADTIGSGAWTLFDPAAYATVAIDTTHRHMRFSSSPGGAATRHVIAYKAAPSNDFTFLCFVANDGFTNANKPAIGLAVGQDLAGAPTTSDLFSFDLVVRGQGVSGSMNTRACTAYNNAGTIASRLCEGPTGVWVRMRVAGIGGGTTDVECDWSTDGMYWTYFGAVGLTYDVLHYGIYYFNPAAQSAQAVAKHFRVFDGVTGPYDSFNGGYLAA